MRIEANGLRVVGDCLEELILLPVGQGAVVVDLVIPGIEANRLAVMGDCFIEFASLLAVESLPVLGRGVGLRLRQFRLQAGNRLGQICPIPSAAPLLQILLWTPRVDQ